MKPKVDWKKFSDELPLLKPGEPFVSIWRLFPSGNITCGQYNPDREEGMHTNWAYAELPDPPVVYPELSTQVGEMIEYHSGKRYVAESPAEWTLEELRKSRVKCVWRKKSESESEMVWTKIWG